MHGATPTDGPGPDPLLQNHVLVAFHPPLLYLGLVGFTVPFAFACASLITGRVGEGWLIETRRWTLFAWGFLTGGVILGAWWSYQVLGWGGYWAWDPVENAAFLPWITATAFLHSVMVQERRGMLRVWNLSLVIATFSLTILATFLTRSGVLESVHSFNNTGIGPALLAFFGVVAAAGVGLLAWRGDRLRSPGAIDSPVSREGAFLANNLLFGAFALVVLLGTVFPLIAQAVNGEQITVGAPYFNRMTMPIVVCLLFLMAVAPVLPWRKASAELLRRRLFWPGVAAVVVLTGCVAFGVRGLNPLLAFGLGAFAGASALRQLVLAVRAARLARPGGTGERRDDRASRRGDDRGGLRRQPLLRQQHPAVVEARAERLFRRAPVYLPGHPERDHADALGHRGEGPDRRWSGVRPGDQRLSLCQRGDRHPVGAQRSHRGHLSDLCLDGGQSR